MSEPEPLRRGKEFQKLVQDDFENHTHDGTAQREVTLQLEQLRRRGRKRGRADVVITELGDFVTLLEIKATDWDRIQPKNIKKNLWSHQRQLFRYVDKFLEVDKLDVCLGIIYPQPPRDPELRHLIETYLEQYGVPAYWFDEIRSGQPA